MSLTEATFLRLIQEVYAAPGDAGQWHVFLDDVSSALHASAASFLAHNRRAPAAQLSLSRGCDPDTLEAYASRWSREDPWAYSPRTRALQTGHVVTGEDLITDDDLRRTAFYNEFGRQTDVTRCLAGMIEVSPDALTCLSINRGDGGRRFGPTDADLVHALLPHVQRAMQLHRRLAAAQVRIDAHAAALDRVAHAVIVLSARGTPIVINCAASALLARRDGLSLDGVELRAARARDTGVLQAAIADAIRTSRGAQAGSGGRLALGRPSGGRPLVVVVSPVPGGQHAPADAAAVVLLITDPDRQPLPSEDHLRQLFGLSGAEARLARLLAEGRPLADAAARAGITIGTARTRLKTIFEKTGVHRQSELARLLIVAAADIPR